MKTNSFAASASPRGQIGHSFLALLALCGGPVLRLTAAEEPAKPAESKEFTMFVGTDLAIMKDKKTYPVVGAHGQVIVFKTEKQIEETNIRRGVGDLRLKPMLKLTRSSAVISNFKSEQAYTDANDPARKFIRAMITTEEIQMHARDFAPGTNPFEVATGNGEAYLSHSLNVFAGVDPVSHMPVYNQVPIRADYSGAANLSTAGLSSNMNNASDDAEFDAMHVSFEVSSAHHFPSAYVVVLTDMRDPTKPGQLFKWVYIEPLDDLGSKPQKVYISEAGFPPGFTVEKTTVHLFSNDQEVATNLAERRLPMTREEAHEYLVLQHIASHRGASLPPSPVLPELPKGFRKRVTLDQLEQPLSIKVDADGKVVDLAAADGATGGLDPYIESAVRNFLFTPALEKGRPVAATVKLTLAELTQ